MRAAANPRSIRRTKHRRHPRLRGVIIRSPHIVDVDRCEAGIWRWRRHQKETDQQQHREEQRRPQPEGAPIVANLARPDRSEATAASRGTTTTAARTAKRRVEHVVGHADQRKTRQRAEKIRTPKTPAAPKRRRSPWRSAARSPARSQSNGGSARRRRNTESWSARNNANRPEQHRHEGGVGDFERKRNARGMRHGAPVAVTRLSIRPECMCSTRSQRAARSVSWVTSTSVVPRSRWPRNRSSMIRARSPRRDCRSARRRRGSRDWARARGRARRAAARRRKARPDSGAAARQSDRGEFALGAGQRVARAGEFERNCDVLQRRHGRDQMERLEHDADIAAAKARQSVFIELVADPGRRPTTEPASGRSSPVITISSVDLPDPDGPSRPRPRRVLY